LLVRIPFVEGAHCDRHQSGRGGGVFELECLPAVERAGHRVAVIIAAEQFQHPVTMMREVRVKPNPAAVAAAIGSGDLVPKIGQGPAVDA
jgi:hypothetical protein